MSTKNVLISLLLIFPYVLSGQPGLLQSGPMLGYCEMREVTIWLQTTRSTAVHAVYWQSDKPEKKYMTNIVTTDKNAAFSAVLIADTLEPGVTYSYTVYLNGQQVDLPYETTFTTQTLWKWRTDPPEFSFLFGSGAYINEAEYDRPGDPYGDGYEIYEQMADRDAEFMIWMGDNVYLRQQEWNTRTGFVHRYTHDRSIPELQRFLASTHHYAIWDDHDYGPNDSDRGFWNKNLALDIFEMFWANPSYGVGAIDGAITSFQWGDADFFLLDNRSFRAPNWLDGEDKTQLGEAQLQWLFDNMVKSYATFKFVVMGGQFLSNSGVYEAYTNYGFANERQKIIDFIQRENIRNVIFLSGDVHFSEVSVLREEGKPTIWDLTSSPMNSGVNTRALTQNNTLRIPESVVMERNFAEVTLLGPKDKRTVKIAYFSTAGDKIWEYTFEAESSAP
jgi:alkaline phosphatase D